MHVLLVMEEFYLSCVMENTEKCNFTCCFLWVLSLVSHTKGRTQIEGV
jgi:hypothetical protein